MQSVAGVVASVVDPDPERVRIHLGLLHGTGSRRAKMNKKVQKCSSVEVLDVFF
jgi:hypothetical protein